ncbi:HAMP domain-containing sensor histidine kinase [Paraclostridium sordellii]|uniref:histidine kinase n=1 Tax=Paraclostridium sordellii TaxID=1505 RepID=A0A0C7PBR1_PARSO|nr:HAMP domain-containing sensor histidine kinase [Paeniclostridium sordellii]CEN79809.1 two-component sensor histidine kinase [[Clostridium] sordellii] [Paeniclostridium sordellii]CEO12446.1 two-component sensor histidine kinase [[Clostridium] sordellii] [Paeniclostridium sordellii]CEP87856.1 two-component sensor histidine kinase [[Clostridium] sordellii] [Paeniclostridium sordellii]CEP97408.1 two-component sensor histidine kinase [[Clostridium] sordellii] [Paeniclostridium sordellii]CEQ01096
MANSNIYFFIVLISIIVSIISIRYAINLRNYLKEFIAVSKKISNKEFHSKINISAKGELGQLVDNFNYMIDTIDTTIQEVEYKNLQLKSIVKSISHGILAIDINGNVLLINKEAKNIIKASYVDPIEGKNINNVIKDEKILNEISRFIGSKKTKMKQITNDEEIVYNIKLDPIYLQSSKNVIIGSIINIENVTERVRLENMRSDFVANVTHELKTPLTSISGFVETLRINENIDHKTRDRFLGIIENESDRLKRLIDDILLLSFIENKDTISYEKIDISNLFKEIYELTINYAKSKNIELRYKIENEDIGINSNRDYIKQIFLNLIDNAIKYTPDGGFVETSVYQNDENIFINIKDNGIGISKEDTSRVFERFYRVDKARSRDVGGTGLGLAIVKHIVKSLNGTIDIKSELNVGTEFIVSIPKKNFLN